MHCHWKIKIIIKKNRTSSDVLLRVVFLPLVMLAGDPASPPWEKGQTGFHGAKRGWLGVTPFPLSNQGRWLSMWHSFHIVILKTSVTLTPSGDLQWLILSVLGTFHKYSAVAVTQVPTSSSSTGVRTVSKWHFSLRTPSRQPLPNCAPQTSPS